MKAKKKLAAWQFGVLLGLQVILFCTMFMPVIRINDSVIKKMASAFASQASKLTAVLGEEMDVEEATEYIEDLINLDDIKELEKENGIKLTSISPVRIMTHSAFKFIYGNKANEPDAKKDFEEDVASDKTTKAVIGAYNALRALFFVIYILDLIVLVLTIVAFVAQWSNLAPAIINTVYGLLVSIFFGIIRFGLVKIAMGKAKAAAGVLGGLVDLGGVTKMISKIMSNLYGIGPLLAFLMGLFLFILGIVCIFIGTPVAGEFVPRVDPYDPPFPPEPDPFNPPEPDPVPITPTPIPTPMPEPMPIPTPAPAPIPQPINPAPVASAGKVMCTKGVAVGQGFQLPVDRKVVVGKSPSKANLVINNQNVSNVHCSIRYNAAHNSYIIKDHSTNGTYVNGVKLPADTPVEYPAGTVLSLADGTNEITLG